LTEQEDVEPDAYKTDAEDALAEKERQVTSMILEAE